MSRWARERRVLYIAEGTHEERMLGLRARILGDKDRDENEVVAFPGFDDDFPVDEANEIQREVLDELLAAWDVGEHVLWYYTPKALGFARHLRPLATVYDCMDELTAFAEARREIKEREAELLKRADLVFTGGQSLYESKRNRHPRVYLFPSSVDVGHFAQARAPQPEPDDQAEIPRPRLGFFGVIDERMDLELVDAVARARPDWQLVVVGPFTKIDTAALPRRENIHYLGPKPYEELPRYLAGWDVAIMPFARNDATRFISPTKTPEYLAGGRPVVSTSIRDVVRPYGELGLARIADLPDEFVRAVEEALAEDAEERIARADEFLAQTSWDETWARMAELVEEVVAARAPAYASGSR